MAEVPVPASLPLPQELPDSKRQKMSSTDEEVQENETSIPRTPKYKRRKVAFFFAYCGVGYQGMQKNPGAKTIEGDLEEALYHSGAVPEEDRGFPRRFDWARSARTDKGVSAVGQVVSGRFFVDAPGFLDRLNSHLVPQIRVFGYKRVIPTFSAKKYCDRRRYVYLIPVFALYPSCHRDRGSVLASIGSENELAKCIECSERGRKVFGVMGKHPFESKKLSDTLENGSAVFPVIDSALREETSAHKSLETREGKDCHYVCHSDTNQDKDVGNGITSSDEANVHSELEKSSKINEDENPKEDNSAHESGSVPLLEKRTEFHYADDVKERFNRILKCYQGTHNFHNFTTRTKAEDPSAKRYIISFNANSGVTIDGINFVKCEVVGQSFMLHQIRKMIGLAVAIMRNCCPESLLETAFSQKVNITVPMAPEVGLYLDECIFSSYNQKWKKSHEVLSMESYSEEAEDFKMKFIYSHIAAAEHKDGAVALWLHSLNRRNYPDLYTELDNSNLEHPSNVEHPSGSDAHLSEAAVV